jgi:hypothetical protein
LKEFEMRNYVIVGLGGRSLMFTDAITQKYKDSATLLGICEVTRADLNLGLKVLIQVQAADSFKAAAELFPFNYFLKFYKRVAAVVKLLKTNLPIEKAFDHHVQSLKIK